MARGKLRIYLGAAPGVGKTFAMLNEGRRRRDRGTDVVVGYVETHGRQNTADADPRSRGRPAQARRLPRHARSRRWTSTRCSPAGPRSRSSTSSPTRNIPGIRNEKRWQDVEELLDAGIDVISTVNIQHLESMNDVVEQITGVEQRETIPDEVVRRGRPGRAGGPDAGGAAPADGARQHLHSPRRSTPRSRNYFRVGNLGALRELALMWVGRPRRRGAGGVPRGARDRRAPGRRASGSSSRSPARRAATT